MRSLSRSSYTIEMFHDTATGLTLHNAICSIGSLSLFLTLTDISALVFLDAASFLWLVIHIITRTKELTDFHI